MDLLAPGNDLNAIKGKKRVAVVDHRAPLSSPVTVLVMLLKAAGFPWYGATKRMPDGSENTSCFIDTVTKYADGREVRRVVWTFQGDDPVDVASETVSLHAMAHFFGFSAMAGPGSLSRGVSDVLGAVREVAPLSGVMPFNVRGRLLLEAAAKARHKEAQLWLADAVDLYRGFCWKLSTPIDHPPHPVYGFPLDRHLRYHKGKKRGDVRASLVFDERMEELRMLGLR